MNVVYKQMSNTTFQREGTADGFLSVHKITGLRFHIYGLCDTRIKKIRFPFWQWTRYRWINYFTVEAKYGFMYNDIPVLQYLRKQWPHYAWFSGGNSSAHELHVWNNVMFCLPYRETSSEVECIMIDASQFKSLYVFLPLKIPHDIIGQTSV